MASYQYVYVMKDLGKTYPGGREVLRNITLAFFPGAKIGVLGYNGAGKSTLLKIMAGIETEFNGEAWAAEGASVGYLSQEPELDESLSVAGNAMEGMGEIKAVVDAFGQVSMKLGEVEDPDEMTALIDRQAELQEKIDAADAWDLDRTIEIAMDALRCPPGESAVGRLSGGERRRVALCRLLLAKPDLLLLDEPTNHLDAESVAWLERHLRDYEGTVVMVTHDRYFLDNVTGWILELDRGHGIPYEGNYTAWLEQKQIRMAHEGKSDDARLASLAGLHPLEFIYGRPSGPGRATAPVVGYVGAGQQVFTIDDHALGAGLDEVDSLVSHASGGPPVVAVRIRGDSMHPMKDGWLLFYTRDQDGVPAECVGRLCILQVAGEGPTLVKEIRRGYQPGTFTLVSWNAAPMEDVALAWAAPVLAIRPA